MITKLFARVIKAEDATKTPWQSVDMAAILISLSMHFDACDRQEKDVDLGLLDRESHEACLRMAQTLVESIVSSPVGSSIRDVMTEAGIDPTRSPLGLVVNHYLPVVVMESQQRPQTPAKGVAILVSALGSAQSESERSQALEDLREYIQRHGDSDLNAHLEQISPAFRNFIVEQLSHGDSATPEKDENESMGNNAMAERLRNLRERLNEKNVDASASPKSQSSRLGPPSPSRGYATDVSTSSAPSSSGRTVVTVSSQSLRERLAAAQENRRTSLVAPESNSTSGSRAAALRARLQAVKQQAMVSSNK